MEKRRLGKSGIEVSAMGMGCWAIGGPWDFSPTPDDLWAAGWGAIDDAETIRAIQAGIDLGITFFDTAANYGTGHSEKILGKALSNKREQVVIATKFGFLIDPSTRVVKADDSKIVENIRQDCEDSLRRMNTDYIDIFQLHQGGMDVALVSAVVAELEALVTDGKIRAYGWSTDSHENARAIAEDESAKNLTSIQFDLNIYRNNAATRAVCEEFDLGGINKSPLNRGILTGKFSEDSAEFPEDDIRHGVSFKEGVGAERLTQLDMVREMLTANGHSLAQGSLAYIWALDERMVPIPGFKTVKQVQENAKAMALGPLSQEQVSEIEKIMGQAGLRE